MLDPPALAAVVRACFDVNRHDVEAHVGNVSPAVREPGDRRALHARALAGVDGSEWPAVSSAATGLHLDEDRGASAACDQVDLDPAHANVAIFDAIPLRFEVVGGTAFAFSPQLLAAGVAARIFGHSSFPRDRGGAS